MYDQIPKMCLYCGTETMVDYLNLEPRPYSRLITLLGFECSQCGRWETVSVTTAAINDLLTRISRVSVGSLQYQKLMFKAITKISNLLARVEEDKRHGESKHSHKITTS